jgi:hypothetical protein
VERQQDVDQYLVAISQLRDMALSPRDSAAFVAKFRDAYINELTGCRQIVAFRSG